MMIRRSVLALGVAALASCAPSSSPPPAPSNVADRTTLDERAALQVEQLYIAAAKVILAADRYGLVPAEARPRIAIANRKAFAAVKATRAAYDAGNAGNYLTATAAANDAVQALIVAFRS